MSKRHCLLIGGTKMVERHLRAALPADMDLAVLRSMDQAMRRMDQQAIALLVFGPTMRRGLAMVATLRRDSSKSGLGLLVVYRDDQRADVQRHSGGQHVADAYIMQSKASRELSKAVETTLSRVQSGLGVVSELLEDLPMDAISATTGEVSVIAGQAAAESVEQELEIEDLEEIELLELGDLELLEDDGLDEGDSATQLLDIDAVGAAMGDSDLVELDDDMLEEIEVLDDDDLLEVVGVYDSEAATETELAQASASLIQDIASEEVLDLSADSLEMIEDEEEIVIDDLEMVELEDEELDVETLEELALEELDADDLEELALEEVEEVEEVEPPSPAQTPPAQTPPTQPPADATTTHAEPTVLMPATSETPPPKVVVEKVAEKKVAEKKVADAPAKKDSYAPEESSEKPADTASKTKSTDAATTTSGNVRRRPRHQSSAQFMAENLSELGKMLSTLQAASAEVGRLESENLELLDRVDVLEASAVDPALAERLQQLEASLAKAEAATAQARAGADEDAARAAARLTAAEARAAELTAEVATLKQAASRQTTAMAAAADLLKQAGQQLAVQSE